MGADQGDAPFLSNPDAVAVADSALDGCIAEPCPPGPPLLLAPQSTARVTSRQPQLRWAPEVDAQSYVVELCADPACTSVLDSMSTTATSVRPSSPIPAAQPVFWRVAATSGGLSTWIATWEFFVGHGDSAVDTSWLGPPDFDRNGRHDVAIGAVGATFVMLNLAPGGLPESTPSETIHGEDRFGAPTANAGDVNGDGYGDLVVGTLGQDGTAYVLLGSNSGLQMVPQVLGTGEMNYGTYVAGVGDTNGDGYSDVVVGTQAVSFLYLGGPAGISTAPTPPTLNGGNSVGAGDVNGDGFADVATCANGFRSRSRTRARVIVPAKRRPMRQTRA